MYDPIQNPEGEFRRAAGGSDIGTSTGGVIIGQEDPLAGLRAVTPGFTAPSGTQYTTMGDETVSEVADDNLGPALSVLALVVAALVALKVVFG